MKFFIDNCLPPRVADALAALDADHTVKHLRGKFRPDTPDLEWIRGLHAEGGWIIVSGDLMYRVKEEREALLNAGLMIFFLAKGWTSIPLGEQASKLFHWWPRIQDEAAGAPRGSCFLVPVRGGKLERLEME